VYVPWYSAALATGLLRLRRVGYHRASVGAAILTQFQRRHLKLHPFCSKTCQPVDGNADGGLLHRISNWTSTSAARWVPSWQSRRYNPHSVSTPITQVTMVPLVHPFCRTKTSPIVIGKGAKNADGGTSTMNSSTA
jgi:hypothetical protein